MSQRKRISATDAADRLDNIADKQLEVFESLDDLMAKYQLPPFAAPHVVQARRLSKYMKDHLELAVELCERGEE